MFLMNQKFVLISAVVILVGLLIISGLEPYDRITWLMEVIPVLIAIPVLFVSFKKFPLTNFAI